MNKDFNTVTSGLLEAAGFTVDNGYFAFLDEASKVQVTDQAMMEMFKFITDKYNAIDFSEIEKSAGDYKRFKYAQLIRENVRTLQNIYEANSAEGADKFLVTLKEVMEMEDFLLRNREQISYLYKAKTGIVQLIYTCMVSSMIYGVSALVAQTIRFVTLEDDADLSVVYDEMNNAAKNIHVKNIHNAVNSISAFEKYIDTVFVDKKRRGATNEAVTLASITAAVSSPVGAAIVGVAAAVIILPRIVPFIREVIYSIYYSRVTISQMLAIQAQLIQTNIESLETSGRASKKVIAKQRKIAMMLMKLQNIIAVKTVDTGAIVNRQMAQENRSLKIDRTTLTSSDQQALLI